MGWHLLGLAEVERARPRRRDCRERYSSDGSADRRRRVWLGKGRRWARAVYWPTVNTSAGVEGSFSMEVAALVGGSCRLGKNWGKRKGLEGW